jgi:hypothetical protein
MVQPNGLLNNCFPRQPRHYPQQRILNGAGEAVAEEPAPPLAPAETAPQQLQRHAAAGPSA